MQLPLLISVPHAGLRVPEEVRGHCILTPTQIEEDGDEGAAEIYAFPDRFRAFVTSEVARAVVDLNRPESDRGPDGVVKTETCHGVRVYDPFPEEPLIERLLERHYRPYHARLRRLARDGVRLGVDCHTMLAVGPAIGPLAGQERPRVCLGNVDGASCPDDWLERMGDCLARAFDCDVSLNHPFKGGFITRSQAAHLPWMQLELSRAPFLSNAEKRACVLAAFEAFCSGNFGP